MARRKEEQERLKKIIWHAKLAGAKSSEIARKLNVTERTVANYLRRAREDGAKEFTNVEKDIFIADIEEARNQRITTFFNMFNDESIPVQFRIKAGRELRSEFKDRRLNAQLIGILPMIPKFETNILNAPGGQMVIQQVNVHQAALEYHKSKKLMEDTITIEAKQSEQNKQKKKTKQKKKKGK